jgi:hypothetical protein
VSAFAPGFDGAVDAAVLAVQGGKDGAVRQLQVQHRDGTTGWVNFVDVMERSPAVVVAFFWKSTAAAPVLGNSGQRYQGFVGFPIGAKVGRWNLKSGQGPLKAWSRYQLQYEWNKDGWPNEPVMWAAQYEDTNEKRSYSQRVLLPTAEGAAGLVPVPLRIGAWSSLQNMYENEVWAAGSRVAFIDCSEFAYGAIMPKTTIPTLYFKVKGLNDEERCGISPLVFWVLVPLMNLLIDLGYEVLVNCNAGANRYAYALRKH